MWNIEDLQESVVKVLMSNHDFTVDEAEEAVKDSVSNSRHLWHENSDTEQLATLLASDDDDD
jgi:hypothetical protein